MIRSWRWLGSYIDSVAAVNAGCVKQTQYDGLIRHCVHKSVAARTILHATPGSDQYCQPVWCCLQ